MSCQLFPLASHAFLAISPQELNEIKDQIQDVEGRYMQGLKEMKVPVCGVCAPHTNPTALRKTCKPHAYSNEAPAGRRTAGGGSASWHGVCTHRFPSTALEPGPHCTSSMRAVKRLPMRPLLPPPAENRFPIPAPERAIHFLVFGFLCFP